MFNLELKKDRDIERILNLSCKLVVLQNLKTCYEYECETKLSQEIKNFRSSCILDEIKIILDNLVDDVEWAANIVIGEGKYPKGQEEALNKIVVELDIIYTFTLEEAVKKETRLKLMELESEIFKDEK